MPDTPKTAEETPSLRRIDAHVCGLCLTSVGSECHVPGCMFWMHDVPTQDTADALRAAVEVTGAEPCRWSADGWCFTHSSDDGPIYCGAKS